MDGSPLTPTKVLATIEPPKSADQTAWERHATHTEIVANCTYCEPPF